MRLEEVQGIDTWLPHSPLADDSLWQRHVSAVTDMDIQLFYARASLHGLHAHAVELVDQVQAAVIVHAFRGNSPAPSPALVLHEAPPRPFLVDELVDGLVALRGQRRQACLFALECKHSLGDVANLQWSHTRQLSQLTPLALEILTVGSRTRHLRLPYVFWEWATDTIATPLLELKWSVEKAFDCTWPELTRRYERLIKLDRRADSASLLDLTER